MQQLTQRACSGLMHRRPHGHLDSFQVHLASFAAFLKDDAEQTAYFVFDFPLDRFRSFFSCGVSVSSKGLARQMVSFVSIKVRLSS